MIHLSQPFCLALSILTLSSIALADSAPADAYGSRSGGSQSVRATAMSNNRREVDSNDSRENLTAKVESNCFRNQNSTAGRERVRHVPRSFSGGSGLSNMIPVPERGSVK